MKGWHRDNYRHSLAAKGYSVKLSAKNRVSMAGVAAPPSYPVEPAPVYKNVTLDWLKETGNYMFENFWETGRIGSALSDSIKESWTDWFGSLAPKGVSKTNEKLIGGAADNVPDEKFAPEALVEGTQVELEHTDDPSVAKEIAKDHIFENSKPIMDKYDSDYYKKLKQIEMELK